VHLKSLTLKGFKSFASSTHLRFEPGINCVVGPNGSGKSNVVDAIAWVLGEQGAKALRGGKMDDVIFAGTAGRQPLGRAEVTLTIDNHDGALPIDYAEVSITRRLYRTGDSEYEINGNSCRLLDIQELLSDSGIGREMHVIVGQGQLDAVLSARPEDRRGFIEEAAGVLKHRKRKEKALRKLDAMQANLTRLTDLTGELRRQLKPLGKQAEMARRAAVIQSEARDARLRLLADDLVILSREIEKEVADETAIRARRGEVEAALTTAQGREGELDAALAEDAPRLARAQETWYRLSALEERFRGCAQIAAERLRFLEAEPEESRPGRDPEELEMEAAAIREQEGELAEALEADRDRLAEAVEVRKGSEQAAEQAERAFVAATRAAADRREGLARLAGKVDALRAKAASTAEEIARLAATVADARERAAEAQDAYAQVETETGGGETLGGPAGESESERALAVAREAYEQAQHAVAELAEALKEAEKERSSWTARQEALALGLTRKDGAGALLAAGGRLPGLLGSVAALLTVSPGYEAALAAALGGLADAVAVAGPADAAAAIALLKQDDGGRAGLLVTGMDFSTDRSDWPALPEGGRWALDVVIPPEELRPALARALDRVAVVTSLADAERLVFAAPEVRAVTLEGDLLGYGWAIGGSASQPSVIEVQAAVEEAQARRDEAIALCARLVEEHAAAKQVAATRRSGVDAAEQERRRADAARSAVSQRLAQLGAEAKSALAEAERVERSRAQAEQVRDQILTELVGLEERLAEAESNPLDDEPTADLRDQYLAAASAARQAEMEVRLAVRTAEERVRALTGRAEQLERAARAEREARDRAEVARAARERGAVIARAVSVAASYALERIAVSLREAATERDTVQQRRVGRERELGELRNRTRELSAELERLTDAVHRDEVARAEQRMRVQQLEAKAIEEFGVDVDSLVAEYGPQNPVPATAAEAALAEERGEPVPMPLPYHRETQEKRAAKAERELTLLGKVNPLALEEFAALEERFKFLSEQLEDLKATRRDLLTVVKEVDERIHDVFASAYADTAREFEEVFKTLFPGGEGRLSLTDPNDMLTTGVEVEARPPGKKVKRLSLLSGGERSLTAVALLVAIFRARPSPFYVMDEVEAALDDVNLGRLISLIEQLREASQLIIITHQKRTMEVADALYGVSMRGDGITQVISQKIRESA
jgi:chromosome segregation protein